jgi:thiol-disulfide isomerase/thioredoxin
MKIFQLLVITVCMHFTVAGQNVHETSIMELERYINRSQKPMIINFWATWCIPCVKELPALDSVARSYEKNDIELVLVSLDRKAEYPQKLQEFLKKRNMSGTFFWLNETNADYFCPMVDSSWSGSIPATLFVNRKAGFRHFFEKAFTVQELMSEVERLVAGNINRGTTTTQASPKSTSRL